MLEIVGGPEKEQPLKKKRKLEDEPQKLKHE